MADRRESDSRKLLRRSRDSLAVPAQGQERLDKITPLISDSMRTEV
jgi:phosphotransferase system, enzyme I, PtsP